MSTLHVDTISNFFSVFLLTGGFWCLPENNEEEETTYKLFTHCRGQLTESWLEWYWKNVSIRVNLEIFPFLALLVKKLTTSGVKINAFLLNIGQKLFLD